jgi:transketolase
VGPICRGAEPDAAEELQRARDRRLPDGLGRRDSDVHTGGQADRDPRRFRKGAERDRAEGPWLIGGSADLAGSNNTTLEGEESYGPQTGPGATSISGCASTRWAR